MDLFSFNGIDIYDDEPKKITNYDLGLVYQGAKRRIAPTILQKIADLTPGRDCFIDLFGGGGSISFNAFKNGYKVFYSDLGNIALEIGYLIDCLRAQKGGRWSKFLPDELFRFITKADFKNLGDAPQDLILKRLYSFGASSGIYLCNERNMFFKEHGHNWVLDLNSFAMQKWQEHYHFTPFFIKQIHAEMSKFSDLEWQKRRKIFANGILKTEAIKVALEYNLDFYTKIKDLNIVEIPQKELVDMINQFCPYISKKEYTSKNRPEELKQLQELQELQQLQRLQRLQELERLERLEELERLQRLQRLQELERLERLEQLERLERLEQLQGLQQLEQLERLEELGGLENLALNRGDYIEALDKCDFNPQKSILYLDPPYKNTANDYSLGDFDYERFYNFCFEAKKRGYAVFISEYDMPEGFSEILAMPKRNAYSGSKNESGALIRKLMTEKLFTIL